jgi:nucleotide-binding universal stress UspA family protein
LNVTYAAARGKPAEALVDEAARSGAQLIVVGNRRMHGLGRVLGSVANSVAHNAPCDVYIAKTDAPE